MFFHLFACDKQTHTRTRIYSVLNTSYQKCCFCHPSWMVPVRALSSVFAASTHDVSFFLTIFSIGVPFLCFCVLSRVRVVRRGRRKFGGCLLCRGMPGALCYFLPPGVVTWVMVVPCVGSAASPCRPECVEYVHPPKPPLRVHASECMRCHWRLCVGLGVPVGWYG